jgi:hypothetical protein
MCRPYNYILSLTIKSSQAIKLLIKRSLLVHSYFILSFYNKINCTKLKIALPQPHTKKKNKNIPVFNLVFRTADDFYFLIFFKVYDDTSPYLQTNTNIK